MTSLKNLLIDSSESFQFFPIFSSNSVETISSKAMEEENVVELLHRYWRDRQIMLDFILFGSIIKKVVMPLGVVTLEDTDLDQR